MMLRNKLKGLKKNAKDSMNSAGGRPEQGGISQDQRRRYNAYVKKQFAGSENPDVMDMKDWVKVNR